MSEEPNNTPSAEVRAAWADALRLAISACEPVDAALIMASELDRMRIGAPLPSFTNAMDEARFWASTATPDEIKAWCLACYEAMTPGVQARFWAYVTGADKQHG